ncbi:unnamed protein product [Cylicocyclus nassatus]|uniref:Domain of unknown function DB domain-containing protein n=1 Tax=Cylicocyclus nassatus TaxID=53992 RepID=A0AA36H9T3_CYLNA|nr:unnamed protein product [Cylicocyclus nassatus]
MFRTVISDADASSANQKLIRCCHGDPQIDKGCAEKYCRIPAINPQKAQRRPIARVEWPSSQFNWLNNVVPFIAECAPKGNTVARVWDCLSSRHEHTNCCRKQGVIPLCMPYCKADGPVPTNMLTYGICIGEFEKYRVCFRTYLKHHRSIRGDE